MTFGERILSIRKRLKWSQDDLAKKIGTSAPIIGRYERNEIKPAIDTAKNIADELGVTIDFLLGGDKKHLFALLDAFLRDAKAKKAYS
ncbi:helix-turn-helix transcriptional regulator [Flavivirga amylovorans]|uniref:Helix-turn-helix transcriptional regulator n=1 Tax=Flavivirga amylovorans TaxID=870486 RepID=A0ABT8WZG4_9FLAO|nr:helix-turn-helix transcriptional regulator [Flavivirga amylovorans]MDO5987071.1 helix-turn-helix transcriptional regulator [Flavivirga amylovorans]